MVAPKGEEPENIPALLVDLAEEAIKAGYAFVRGDVIGPRGTLFEGYEFTALYVSLPFCLSDSFAVVELEPGANVRFAWLVPISSAEAEFVKSHGWNRFEEIMETKEVDVLPLERASVF